MGPEEALPNDSHTCHESVICCIEMPHDAEQVLRAHLPVLTGKVAAVVSKKDSWTEHELTERSVQVCASVHVLIITHVEVANNDSSESRKAT